MIDVVIVGDGPVCALVEQSPVLALCAVIDGDPGTMAAAYPRAAFVVAALPRTSGAAIAALAALGRRTIVIPPMAATTARHPAIGVAPLTVGQRLAIDPGWTDLTLDVAGLELGDEPRALWWHALAIASSLGAVVVRDVELSAGRARLDLDGRSIALTVAASRAVTTIAWSRGTRFARGGFQVERHRQGLAHGGGSPSRHGRNAGRAGPRSEGPVHGLRHRQPGARAGGPVRPAARHADRRA